MNITVAPGERVYFNWTLPFDTPVAAQVVLPTAGDELSFYQGDSLIASFARHADGDVYWLGYANNQWCITFDTNDTSFLLPGVNRYEFILLDADGLPLLTDEGTVTLNG